jgi:hypothetical protein
VDPALTTTSKTDIHHSQATAIPTKQQRLIPSYGPMTRYKIQDPRSQLPSYPGTLLKHHRHPTSQPNPALESVQLQKTLFSPTTPWQAGGPASQSFGGGFLESRRNILAVVVDVSNLLEEKRDFERL